MKGNMSSQKGRGLCRQNFPNTPMYIEPVILSVGFVRDEGMSASRPIVKLICVSGRYRVRWGPWGMAVLTLKVVICASLEYGFVSLTSFMRKTIIELIAGTGSQ